MVFDDVKMGFMNGLYVVYLIDAEKGVDYALSRSAHPAWGGSVSAKYKVEVRDLPDVYVHRHAFPSEAAAKVLVDKIFALLTEAERLNYRVIKI